MYIWNKLKCFKNFYLIKNIYHLWKKKIAEYLLFLRSFKTWFPSTASFTVNGFVSSQGCEFESLATFFVDSHGSHFSPTRCYLWCVKCEWMWLVCFMQALQQHPGSCSQLLIVPQTSPLLLLQPVSGRKCILVTFLFGWFLTSKPAFLWCGF